MERPWVPLLSPCRGPQKYLLAWLIPSFWPSQAFSQTSVTSTQTLLETRGPVCISGERCAL